jgi:hypothetical protein
LTANVPTLELEVPFDTGGRCEGVWLPSPTGVCMSEPERKSLFGMEEEGGWWTASICELVVFGMCSRGMAKIYL